MVLVRFKGQQLCIKLFALFYTLKKRNIHTKKQTIQYLMKSVLYIYICTVISLRHLCRHDQI